MKERIITWKDLRIEVYYEMDGNECLIHDLVPYCEPLDMFQAIQGNENALSEIADVVELREAEDWYERNEGDTCPDVDDIVSERRL